MCLPKSRTIAGGSLLSLIRYKEIFNSCLRNLEEL